jgi:hypothetical protein
MIMGDQPDRQDRTGDDSDRVLPEEGAEQTPVAAPDMLQWSPPRASEMRDDSTQLPDEVAEQVPPGAAPRTGQRTTTRQDDEVSGVLPQSQG